MLICLVYKIYSATMFLSTAKYLRTAVISITVEGPYQWNASLYDVNSNYYKYFTSQFVKTVC